MLAGPSPICLFLLGEGRVAESELGVELIEPALVLLQQSLLLLALAPEVLDKLVGVGVGGGEGLLLECE